MTERIPTRPIGASGLQAGVLSLGSWHTYDRMDFTDAVELVRPQQGVVKPFAIKRDIKRIADRDCVIREVFDRTGLREEAPIEPVHPAWPSFPLRSFHLPKHRRHMPNGRVIRVRHLAHELDRGSFDLSDLERGNSEVPER